MQPKTAVEALRHCLRELNKELAAAAGPILTKIRNIEAAIKILELENPGEAIELCAETMRGKEFPSMFESQMFDPPYCCSITVAGRPIFMIPNSEKKYRNFLEWWFEVGRLKPDDPQGWDSISGPWVMMGRQEAISLEEWAGLPESERRLIRSWAERLPIGVFYD